MIRATRSAAALQALAIPALAVACVASSDRVRPVSVGPAEPGSVDASDVQPGEPVRTTPPEPDVAAPADLDVYVAIALERSGEVRAAYEAWQAAEQRPLQAGTLPDPRLSYSDYLEEVQTRTGPQRRSLGLSQTFPWPGTLERRRGVATEEARAMFHAFESARLRVERDVRMAFLAYAFLARELEIRTAQAALLRNLESVVGARVRAGAGLGDLLRLQVEVGRLEDDVARLERRRPALSARLAATMNLPLDGPVLPSPDLEVPGEVSPPPTSELIEAALARSPGLRALESTLRARREGVELASISRNPDITLGLSTIATGSALDPATPGSGDDPWILSVSLPLPVWVSTDDAVEREARHRVRAAHVRLEQARADLVAAIEGASFDRDDALRRVELYRGSLVPRAQEALSLTESSYRAGDASLLDVIDSERALLEFRLSYWTACRHAHEAFARLDALTGVREPGTPTANDMPTDRPSTDRTNER